MKQAEIPKLLDLIDTLCPDSPHPARDKKTLYAYYLALAPYDYDDVKAKALEFVRTSKYYPRVNELIPNVTSTEASLSPAKTEILSPKELEELRNNVKEIQDYYHKHDVKSPLEAKKAGISYRDWSKAATKAGAV